MNESGRVERLGSLLESKNHLIRREAASALALTSASSPQLWTVLRAHLYSSAWEARVAASEAFRLLLENLVSDDADFHLKESSSSRMNDPLDGLDIRYLVEFYKPLLSDAEATLTTSTERPTPREQRSRIDQCLDMSSTTGVSSRSFLADDEISNTQQRNSPVPAHPTTLKDLEVFQLRVDENDDHIEHFIDTTLIDLADRRWQTRHGAALAVAKLLATLKLERLGEYRVKATALRLLQITALDRFNDFITGASSIAPVREAVAQALCLLLTEVEEKRPELASELFSHLETLMSIQLRQLWHCRQTGLLVLKYYFSACTSATERLSQLLHTAVALTKDHVDEVISAAVVALASLFENRHLSDAAKRPLVERVMGSVWAIMDDEERHRQIREGVDSLLTDLLNVIASWMRIDPSSSLSSRQLSFIAGFIDPKFIERSQKAMECLSKALEKHIELGHEEIFALVKRLYRFLLLSPIRDGHHQSVCHQALVQLTSAVGEDFARVEAVQQTIGYWLACLVYDNKTVEIDVFAHRVDGPNSIASSAIETLCGEEIHCMDEERRGEELVRKKLAAAEFLAHLMDLLYASGLIIGDQPIHLSVQLLLVPYLKSTSLHQRLGASLLINALSRCWRERATRAEDSSWPYPSLLAEALEEVVYKPLKIYDEVALAISTLTGDCNEFQSYCAKKGAPREELIVVDKTNSMEAVVEGSYQGCLAKLTEAEDRETLAARYNYVLHLIKSAKMAIRTNTGRVAAICATSLLRLGRLPNTLTPLVKTLMEATEWEENCLLAEKVLCEAFPLLISATARRVPCPHSKLFKQLCTGMVSCEKFAPVPDKWPNQSFAIISLNEDFNQPCARFGVKSVNCHRMMGAIFHRASDDVLEECPELQPYFRVGSDQDLERNLLNMEVTRLHGECLGSSSIGAFADADYIFSLLGGTNPAVRYRAARFLASYASSDLPTFLNAHYHRAKEALGNLDADHLRCGVIELLMMLAAEMSNALLGAASLLAPLPLRSISDPIEEVRSGAMLAFGRMVPLLPLEREEKHALVGLDQSLTEDYRQSFHFAHVLTKPGELPRVRRGEVPGLRPNAELRDYQLEGITWMNYLWRFGLNGILADDMGLGKTLQTLCLLSMHQEANGQHPSLIVCPKTLVQWWCSEWSNYFPGRAPLIQLKSSDEMAAKLNGSASTVVASYEQLRSQRALWTVRWASVVLDEGHCIRNSTSQLFDVVTNQLVAMRRLILSGTPVQNTPADLWSLFAFLMPGYLSTKPAFHAKYMRRIMACRSPKASDAQIKEGEEALSQLHRQVLPFIMRRLKGDVLRELPDKVIVDYPCELSSLQRRLYSLIVDHCSLKAGGEQTRRATTTTQQAVLSPLQTLITLRRLVDHPLLVGDVVARLDPTRSTQQANAGSYELSGKMVALKELLEECQIGGGAAPGDASYLEGEDSLGQLVTSSSKHRALIFCQWKGTVDLVASYIDAGVFGSDVSYSRLDGTIPPNERQSIADMFNRDNSIDLLLLTTQIGGVGLTLTGADVVIFVDHDWNPTRDAQAIDRAHRLGQKRTVNVYRLITRDSIEEKVMNLQRFKTNTANALVGSDNRSLSTMNADELMDMFALGNDVDKGSGPGEPALKKRRQGTTIPKSPAGTTNRDATTHPDWSLDQLWDNSGEYEEQYGIDAFKRLYAK